MRTLNAAAYWAAIAITALAAAECAARLHDLARHGTPFFHTPDRDRDLMVTGPSGERCGRPHGQYQHYKLNAYGFRSPEISEHPGNGIIRVLVLGSSEAFGLYETPGHDFSTLLAKEL